MSHRGKRRGVQHHLPAGAGVRHRLCRCHHGAGRRRRPVGELPGGDAHADAQTDDFGHAATASAGGSGAAALPAQRGGGGRVRAGAWLARKCRPSGPSLRVGIGVGAGVAQLCAFAAAAVGADTKPVGRTQQRRAGRELHARQQQRRAAPATVRRCRRRN
eukprot:265984-Chlamydomonas_euryale.AAC.2